ncbi:MAG: LPS export ABC transporter periplasmic protein LptC [Nitrospiraceae bacterium]
MKWERVLRRFLLAASVILASFLAYLLFTRTESVPALKAAPNGFERADATIKEFAFTQTKSGVVQWEVRAQHARLFEGESRAVLERVHVTLLGPQGRELSLEGDEGMLDTARKDFILSNRSDPIKIETESGYTIYSNHLSWSDERREISTTAPVTISGHGLQVNGRGLVAKPDVEEFQVLEDVRVDIAASS